MTVALCLITWNEIDGVRHDIPLIDRTKFEQIYCIDGGSTDGTVEYLEENGIPVYYQTARGLNQACIDGVAHCNCDAFVFFHPKGTIPVEDTYKFRPFFEEGYELVVGSRRCRYRDLVPVPFKRDPGETLRSVPKADLETVDGLPRQVGGASIQLPGAGHRPGIGLRWFIRPSRLTAPRHQSGGEESEAEVRRTTQHRHSLVAGRETQRLQLGIVQLDGDVDAGIVTVEEGGIRLPLDHECVGIPIYRNQIVSISCRTVFR